VTEKAYGIKMVEMTEVEHQ